jgi:coproporphyrinogen III oxidase-like Fe-S oxidoreductase
MGAGIHGFSLYHLNVTDRNSKFFGKIRGFSSDLFQDYLDFIISDQFLTMHGYKKNHFVHYALKEDKNLYYNHVRRGEDLLALGPTADGIFRSFYYIHYWIKEYLSVVQMDYPPLWGGGYLSEREFRIRPVKAELMCSKISESTVKKFNIQKLTDEWKDSDLIRKTDNEYCLTGNGSWYIDNMVAELADHFRLPV